MRVFIIGLMVLAWAGAVQAATNKHGVAVIIGNKNYRDETVPAVDFALNDAEAVRQFVVGVLGYNPDNIIDLRNATQADIFSAFGNQQSHEGKLWRYIDHKGRSDVVVFYSGHGVPGQKDKRGYLLPTDADPNAPEINGYPIDLLYKNLAKLKAKSITVFLDACFSGGSHNGMLIRAASPVYIEAERPPHLEKLTVLTAGSGAQLASWDEDAKHGLFTHHLLDGLYGRADEDKDGRVTLAELREFVSDNVIRAARRTYGRNQVPDIQGRDDAVIAALPAGKRFERPTIGNPSNKVAGITPLKSAGHAITAMTAMVVALKRANLRSAPTVASDRAGRLAKDQLAEVTGKATIDGKTWYRLRSGSRTAFVAGWLVKQIDTGEAKAWVAIKDSRDAADFDEFLGAYPTGHFARQAKRRIVTLRPELEPAKTKQDTGLRPGPPDLGPGSQNDLFLKVGDRIFFEFDSFELTPEAMTTLERWASWLQTHQDITVLLEGHTDSRGDNNANLRKGERSAETARNMLIALGVSPHRVDTISYGESRPTCTSESEMCWALNRRVVMVIVP